MIKALLLIFEPAAAWDKVVQSKQSLISLIAFYLLPLVLMSVGGELSGLIYWGKKNEAIGQVVPISQELALFYGAAQFGQSILVVFLGANVVKSLAKTFHTRNTYAQCLALVAYALSPLFTVRLLDSFPGMNPWVTMAIGMVLTFAVLYQGVPKMLTPDPPHAFGLYMMSGLLIIMIAGMGRVLSLLVLTRGKLTF